MRLEIYEDDLGKFYIVDQERVNPSDPRTEFAQGLIGELIPDNPDIEEYLREQVRRTLNFV